MRRASLQCREISRKVEGWSSTEEIRKWRERRPNPRGPVAVSGSS